ncbi:hypothetical protein pb186bvf_008687 [Paramecium bursaria]
MDSFLIQLTLLTGVPIDQIKMLTGFFISVTFGFAFKNFQNPQLRLTSGAIVGVLLTIFVYEYAFINILIQTIIVYVMVKYLGKNSPWPVFIETLLFLSIHHIYRQITDYGGWTLDVTTILMMNTAKWTSFAFQIQDGLNNKCSKEQQERAIRKFPTFLEYFSFSFFFAGCLAGPAYDYHDFYQFIHQQGGYQKIGSTTKEVLKLSCLSFGLITTYMYLSYYFPFHWVISQEFGSLNFLQQLIWLNVMITVQRCKYYAGFCFSELSISSCGLTWEGGKFGNKQQFQLDGNLKEMQEMVDKLNMKLQTWEEGKFGKIKQIDLDWDLQYNMKDKVEKWNISIQTWLRRYVYQRIYSEEEMKKNPSKQQISFQTTFMISAIWHGYYPGYYFAFVQWAILNSVNKFSFKWSLNNPIFNKFDEYRALWFIRWFVAQSYFTMCGTSFLLLSIDKILLFYANTNYILNISLIMTYAVFVITGIGQRKKKI